MPRTALTQAEVFDTAAAILRTLKSLGYDACFVGSVACSLYGMVRTPTWNVYWRGVEHDHIPDMIREAMARAKKS